jgi:hypothetical protein
MMAIRFKQRVKNLEAAFPPKEVDAEARHWEEYWRIASEDPEAADWVRQGREIARRVLAGRADAGIPPFELLDFDTQRHLRDLFGKIQARVDRIREQKSKAEGKALRVDDGKPI